MIALVGFIYGDVNPDLRHEFIKQIQMNFLSRFHRLSSCFAAGIPPLPENPARRIHDLTNPSQNSEEDTREQSAVPQHARTRKMVSGVSLTKKPTVEIHLPRRSGMIAPKVMPQVQTNAMASSTSASVTRWPPKR